MLLRIAVVALLATGCAGVQLNLPQPGASAQADLARLFSAPVEPSRGTRAEPSRMTVVRRIDEKILPAAIRVCERTFNNPEDCRGSLSNRTIVVATRDEGINASVGQNFDLTILGGITRVAGSDDEIALVMAHEYSHALFGHVARSTNNSMLAGLLGALGGAALAGAVGANDVGVAVAAAEGASIGESIGWTAFSKDMELEADHLALFILDDAGYNMDKGMQFFQRTLRMEQHYRDTGQQRSVGFFQTHPSDEERLLRLLATKEMIERGADRPVWNP